MIRNSDDVVTTREAAALLKCGVWAVRQLIKARKLTGLRGLGKGYRILRSDLDAELDRRLAERKAEAA